MSTVSVSITGTGWPLGGIHGSQTLSVGVHTHTALVEVVQDGFHSELLGQALAGEAQFG
jgi:hypothetical protein